MIRHTGWAAVVLCAALASSAPPAAASIPGSFALVNATAALRATCRTALQKNASHATAAHAVSRHTVSHARGVTAAVHTATTRHVRRHHRHATAVLALNRTPVQRSSLPERPPARERPHRATLPLLTQSVRHAPQTKYGPRHTFAVTPVAATWALAAGTLELRRDVRPDPRVLTVTGGRGPPRGSPAGPSRGRATSAPASADDSDAPPCASSASPLPPHTSRAPGELRLAGASACAQIPFIDVSEVGSRRLHADRPEGATACLAMPSSGGTPCPASSR